MNKEELQHEKMRREFYMNVLIAYTRADNSTKSEWAKEWAESVLNHFDEKFPKPLPKQYESISPSQNLYYIRKEGFLGNALYWWMEDNNSYDVDIRKARIFKKKEAFEICKTSIFTAYKCEYINELFKSQKLIIDAQYLDSEEEIWK
jgi:hypothetical protein